MTKEISNIFIIGVHRAATTSLFRYLSSHPQINSAYKKELHYFTRGIYSGSYQFDPLEYRQLYPVANGIKLEASPSYFYGGKALAQLMNESFIEPRFILILRNPADRFLSFYRHFSSEIQPSKRISIDEFFSKSVQEHESKIIADNHVNRAIREGVYADYLEPWMQVGKQKLKIVYFEDIELALQKSIEEVCNFLLLDPTHIDRSTLIVHNESREIRNYQVNWLAKKVNRLLEHYFTKNLKLKSRIKKAYGQLNEKDFLTSIPDSIYDELNRYYLPHNKRLKDSLIHNSLSLPNWLEDL
ncbi:MAG: sulfotransferase [Cytophagia bacterium]|nr:sulfotransferase [Cytophagia bacterium]